MLMADVFAILDSVEIPMRDGTILRADVWLPGGEGRWPVLLQRTSYRKEDAFGAQTIAGLDFRMALRRGYAIVVQDVRGRFASDGAFAPFVSEQQDGYDTVEWLKQQKFCNGQVAMFGASYVGATQVLAATNAPPGLVAIAPQLTTARQGETWLYRGGALELGFLMLWIAESLSPVDLPRRAPTMGPETAARALAVLKKLHEGPTGAFARLPLFDADLQLLAPYASEWFDDRRARAASKDRQTLEALATSRVGALVICGWNDIFLEGSIELFETMRGRWSDAAAVPDRLIVGPWSHGGLSDWQGDFWHGYGAAGWGVSDEQLGFFDATMKGTLPPSPMVRYFRTGSNTWHASSDWPVPATPRTFFLNGPDGSLRAEPAEADWTLSYRSDPLDPVPTIGGATLLPGAGQGRNSGPKDQAAIELRKDVLVFTSDPVAEDVEVTGLVEARLWVRSSAPDCDWTVRLCEVDEHGRSIGRVDGILRWTNPHPGSGGPVAVTVRLGHVSHLFRAGSRLRIQIASSNFPRFDRNPQSGVAPAAAIAADFTVADQTIVGGPRHPSGIVLPVALQSPALTGMLGAPSS